MSRRFSWSGYFLRLVLAVVVVFATYNPEGLSYIQWVYNHWNGAGTQLLALMTLVGVLILIGWVIFIRATYHSLGPFGTILAIAFFAALIWLVMSVLPVPKNNFKLVAYFVLFGLAGVLSAGLSWSHVRRRLSGQLDVDVDDDIT